MATRRNDTRALRSQESLYSALLELVTEQGFEATAVQHILDRAHVGRATFYAHFRTKEDLLLYGLDKFRSELLALSTRPADAALMPMDRLLRFSAHVFEHAAAHAPLYSAMVGRRSGATLALNMHKLLAGVIREDLRAAGIAATDLEPAAQCVAGGLAALLEWWMTSRMRMSSGELNRLFRDLTLRGLEQICARPQQAAPQAARRKRSPTRRT